jgi:hypothetical protein
LLVKEGELEQKLVRGALTDVAKKFQCDHMNDQKNMEKGAPKFHIFSNYGLPGKSSEEDCSQKQKYNRDEAREAILLVPLHMRKTLRKLASSIGILVSTVHRMKTDPLDNVIVPHSNAIKPFLHDYHLVARVFYTASNLDLEDSHYRATFNWFTLMKNVFS